ncbi:MAG: G5 domain-containing protein [Anaerolineaceae bacterium]|nr:G5 domain-containing protein [Anaerolineaceae bacterium]
MKKNVFFVESLLDHNRWHDCQILWLVSLLVFILLAGCAPIQTPQALIQVSIQVDGKQIALKLPAGSTAQTALDQGSIKLSNLDRVEPPGYTVLKTSDVVQVTRVREVFTVEEMTIPFEHRALNNETLPDGQTLLVQRGVNGTEQVTHRQVFENDTEISNTIFKTEVIVEPLPEIIMVGVQKPFTPVAIPGKLAYLTGGNAWLMETTTGNRRPVVTTGDLDGRVFKLSPKGDWLLFTRIEKKPASADEEEKINSLWAVSLAEENARPVNLKVSNVIHFADWMPGQGLTILYSTVEPRTTAPGWQANNDLQLLTFAASGAAINKETILDTNDGGFYGWWGMDFAWSPDGALLAYSRPDEVGLVDIENKKPIPINSIIPFQTGSDWAWVPGIGWAADHNVLFIVNHVPKAGLDSPEKSPLFDVAGLVIDGETFSADGPLISLAPQAGMFAYPVPSPQWQGGNYLVAYLQSSFPEQSDSKRYRLVVMDRDGSNRKVIFPAADRQGLDPQRVSWSPQPFEEAGASSAALTSNSSHPWLAVIYQGNLWLVDAQTGDPQQVTGDGLVTHIDWK